MLRRETLVISLILVVTFAARWLPGPRTIDDAYITFRYARNILAGNGFVYNTGERVLGTTTPLYTGLMAVEAGILGRRDAATGQAVGFPELALITNALADCASAWLLYRAARRLGGGSLAGLALAAVWSVHPVSVTYAVGGMETSVFVALILGTFIALVEARPRATATLAALSLLVRPEASIAIVLLIGYALLNAARDRAVGPPPASALMSPPPSRIPRYLGIGLLFFAVLAPWLIFATLYFGNPIPGSIAAKGVAYQLDANQALAAFMRTLVVPFSGVGSFDAAAGLLFLAAYATLFVLGAVFAVRRNAAAWPMMTFALAYLAAYVVANPLIFRWYVVPPLPIFLLGIALGWTRVTGVFHNRTVATSLFGLGAVVAIGAALGGWWISDHGSTSPSPRMSYIKLELTYLEAAEKLSGVVDANTVIAAGDIGAIGYATGARIYDTLGLITPDARRYYPVPRESLVPPLPYAIPAQLILDAKPDFVIIVEAYGRNTFLPDPRFQAEYELLEKLTSDATRDYSSEGMLVFGLGSEDRR